MVHWTLLFYYSVHACMNTRKALCEKYRRERNKALKTKSGMAAVTTENEFVQYNQFPQASCTI